MAYFLEERLNACVLYETTYGDNYSVEVVETGGSENVAATEYRRLNYPYPRARFTIGFQMERKELFEQVMSFYHRCFGRFAGFRFKHIDDYTTANDNRSAPTALDHNCSNLGSGTYQIVKRYARNFSNIGIGWPARNIYKPVNGTVLVGVAGAVADPSTYTVDHTTGKITFAADKVVAISGITKAANAVVTVPAGHGLTVNKSVYFSAVAGMTQINGLRGIITAVAATSITVNIATTSFSNYTSGGTLNTRPQAGETVSAGCEFDYPVRFNSDYTAIANHPTSRRVEFELIELLNI